MLRQSTHQRQEIGVVLEARRQRGLKWWSARFPEGAADPYPDWYLVLSDLGLLELLPPCRDRHLGRLQVLPRRAHGVAPGAPAGAETPFAKENCCPGVRPTISS